jgi:hypothetical protein
VRDDASAHHDHVDHHEDDRHNEYDGYVHNDNDDVDHNNNHDLRPVQQLHLAMDGEQLAADSIVLEHERVPVFLQPAGVGRDVHRANPGSGLHRDHDHNHDSAADNDDHDHEHDDHHHDHDLSAAVLLLLLQRVFGVPM